MQLRLLCRAHASVALAQARIARRYRGYDRRADLSHRGRRLRLRHSASRLIRPVTAGQHGAPPDLEIYLRDSCMADPGNWRLHIRRDHDCKNGQHADGRPYLCRRLPDRPRFLQPHDRPRGRTDPCSCARVYRTHANDHAGIAADPAVFRSPCTSSCCL